MGTVSDKLTYLNTTKEKIKENLNYAGCNITNEPFRQYASILKDKFVSIISNPEQEANAIYDSFPKAINTGTHITTNTYNTRFDMDLLGDTSQDGTPTPSSPIPVNVVSGDNEINICGKNLFDISTITPNHYYEENGSYSEASTYDISDYIIVDSNTTYTFSSKYTTSGYMRVGVVEFTSDKAFIIRNVGTNYNYTFTTGNNTKYIRVQYRKDATAYDIQVVKGNQATTYEPYKGKTYEVNLGKNIFKENDYTNLTLTNNSSPSNVVKSTDKITFTANGNWSGINITNPSTLIESYDSSQEYWLSCDIKVNASTTMQFGNTTKNNFDLVSGIQRISIKTTIGSGSIVFYNRTADTINYEISKIQIEKGSQATSYSPYFTPIELCKIGTYQDKIKKSTGKNLFDGTLYNGQWGSNGGYSSSTQRITNVPQNGTSTLYLEKGTYTLSIPNLDTCSCLTKDSNGTIIDNFATQWNNLPFTFTLTQGGFLYFTGRTNNSAVLTPSDYIVQIEQGSTATDYEPYGKVWYLHKEIGKYVFTGNEGWTQSTNANYSYYMYSLSSPTTYFINYARVSGNTTISSKYKGGNNPTGSAGVFSQGNYICCFRYNQYDTIDGFYITSSCDTANNMKTEVKDNIVYYVLATPTTTEITNTELINQLDNIELLDGYNEITVSGDLPTILYLKTIPK